MSKHNKNKLVFVDTFDYVAFVETEYFNADMCKSESSHSHESIAHSTDSSKGSSKTFLF